MDNKPRKRTYWWTIIFFIMGLIILAQGMSQILSGYASDSPPWLARLKPDWIGFFIPIFFCIIGLIIDIVKNKKIKKVKISELKNESIKFDFKNPLRTAKICLIISIVTAPLLHVGSGFAEGVLYFILNLPATILTKFIILPHYFDNIFWEPDWLVIILTSIVYTIEGFLIGFLMHNFKQLIAFVKYDWKQMISYKFIATVLLILMTFALASYWLTDYGKQVTADNWAENGIYLKTTDSCKWVDGTHLRTKCIAAVALSLNNSELCNQIENGIERVWCQSKFNS